MPKRSSRGEGGARTAVIGHLRESCSAEIEPLRAQEEVVQTIFSVTEITQTRIFCYV